MKGLTYLCFLCLFFVARSQVVVSNRLRGGKDVQDHPQNEQVAAVGYERRMKSKKGSKGAKRALDITEDNERLIGSVLLGNNVYLQVFVGGQSGFEKFEKKTPKWHLCDVKKDNETIKRECSGC